MKASKLILGIAFGVAALALSTTQASAQFFSETWISGTVYNTEGSPVNGGSVNVTCGSTTKLAIIDGSGNYAKMFTQVECKAGDTASATASTGEGSGTNSEVVQNSSVNGPIVDLDVAVIDITVPEFGVIGGALTGLISVGGYLVMRSKSMLS